MRGAYTSFLNALRVPGDFVTALVVFAIFALIRALPAHAAIQFGGQAARMLGPLVPRSRMALRQIAKAFPEKTSDAHRAILRACWDNLGRTAIEYCHLEEIWDFKSYAQPGHIEIVGGEYFEAMRNDGKPAIIV